ncbi:DUF968 domain-containing protein [Escherichia coli]|uniref:DUF968 domain-containing protein n=2 Tax=Escherichia coli TaxID=562 RepID=UPI0035BE5A06
MSLLFAERPLVINTQLAMKIGLNEAIVLQQLHYWLRDTNSGMECDGVRWIYNTTEQWLEQFPFWSESTLKRAFASLKTLGLLRCEKLNKSKRDMTNFYTINYGSELLDGGKLSESIGLKCAAPSGQNDTMEEVKTKRSIGSKRPNVIGSKWPDDLTENTTEIKEKYTRWVKTQPCACCGMPADDPHHLIGHGQGGMGTKAHDLFVLPLCRKHHNELHTDTVAFEEKYGSQLELIFRFIDRALAIGVLA